MVKGEFFTVEHISSRNGSPRLLRFFGRDEQKNKIDVTIDGPRPYFFILKEEEDKIDFPCETFHGFKSLTGEELIKVVFNNPWDVRDQRDWETKQKIADGYVKKFSRTFEADLPYPTRYLIDTDTYSGIEIIEGQTEDIIKPADVQVEPRVMTVDIETEYYGGSNSEMECPINCIGFHDNYGNRFYSLAIRPDGLTGRKEYTVETEELGTKLEVLEHWCADEKELLQLFLSFVRNLDVDIFTGWNVNFDMVYICHRMDVQGIGKEKLSPIGKVKPVWIDQNRWDDHQGAGRNLFKESKIDVPKQIKESQQSLFELEELSSGESEVITDAPQTKTKQRAMMIRGRAIIDLLKGYKRIKWKQIASFRLDTIAQVEFKSGKVDYQGWMGDFWKHDFEQFIRYNIRDVEICLAINKKYSIIDSLLGIRRMSGCELSDILYNSKIIDTYILRFCKNQFVMPTKLSLSQEEKTRRKEEHKVEGGFVLEPKTGILKNICVLDLKSLYPSIMLSFNMSPETVDENGEIIVGNGVKFRKETGILKQILLDILAKRDELRAMLKRPEINSDPAKYINIYKRQYYYKTFQNSFYGVTLYVGFRLWNPNIGSSITFVGRTLAHKIKDLADSMGYTVIRQDTDSAMVDVSAKSPEEAIQKGKELEAAINNHMTEWFAGQNNDINYLSIKFEKLYGLMFTGAEKKLYAGKIIWDWEKGDIRDKPDTEIKGFATVKSDRSSFSKKFQKHIFEMVFNEASADDIKKYIIEEIDNFFNNKYSFNDIGIPKSITRDLDDYKVKNPWIKGVEFSMKNIKGFTFQPKPLLLYVKRSDKYPTDYFCFNSAEEIPKDLEIDMDAMAERSIYRVVSNMLPILGIPDAEIRARIDAKTNPQQRLGNAFGYRQKRTIARRPVCSGQQTTLNFG